MLDSTEALTAARAARDKIRKVVDGAIVAGRKLTDGGKAVVWEFEPSEGALEGLV